MEAKKHLLKKDKNKFGDCKMDSHKRWKIKFSIYVIWI